MSDQLTVYGHNRCPMVPVLRHILEASQVNYVYVDIKQDQRACEQVKHLNNGNESVPTLVFADGSHLTEPSTVDLRAKLKQLGIEMVSPRPKDILMMLLLGRKSTH
jgi:mycoredoxin